MRCFSSRKIDTYSWMSKLVVSTIRRKKIDHGISVCFQGELSVIQLNSPFFLLVLLRSVLIAKKKEFNFFFLFFLFLNSWEDIRRNVSFNYLQNSDHKKTSNFTTRSGRDQRQTKEIANSLLIFKLSFIQKYKYLQLGDKTHSLAIENFPSFPQRN